MRSIIFVLFLCLFFNFSGYSENIFKPFLDDKMPEIVETVSKEQKDGVEITRIKFISRRIEKSGEKVIIYGILARPVEKGIYPGILVCHGGGGSADKMEPTVYAWAKRGYIAFCQDQPGICGGKNNSSGPWKKLGWSNWTIKPDATSNRLYDGVAAALNGLSILRNQSDIDKKRIGVIGSSWGGYMTTMISALAGDKIKASFCIYGCGFYDVGSQWLPYFSKRSKKWLDIWTKNLDAGRRASKITSNFFSMPATNDWYFWPSAAMKTYEQINSQKNIVFSPNDNHFISIPGGKTDTRKLYPGHATYMEILWMDYYLKGEGKPFPTVSVEGGPVRADNKIKVRFKVKSELPVKNANVYYSFGETPWRCRFWEKAKPEKQKDGSYAALIPVFETALPINWFPLIQDERNISVSTIIQKALPLNLGFKAEERCDSLLFEDFESPNRFLRWEKFTERYNRHLKAKINAQAAYKGKYGLQLFKKAKVRYNGFRGEAFKQSGSKGISFYAKASGENKLIIEIVCENANGAVLRFMNEVKGLDTEWKKYTVLWKDFKKKSKARNTPEEADETEFIPSASTGALELSTSTGTEVFIDNIETVN